MMRRTKFNCGLQLEEMKQYLISLAPTDVQKIKYDDYLDEHKLHLANNWTKLTKICHAISEKEEPDLEFQERSSLWLFFLPSLFLNGSACLFFFILREILPSGFLA